MLILLIFMSAVSTAHPSPERLSCSWWRGTAAGNDPSVQLTVALCEFDGNVTGTLKWQSDRSGTSVRNFAGTRSGGALVLHDTALSGTPNPGWTFCTIDEYRLSGAGTDRLAGTYHSKQCRDDARLVLARVR